VVLGTQGVHCINVKFYSISPKVNGLSHTTGDSLSQRTNTEDLGQPIDYTNEKSSVIHTLMHGTSTIL